MAKYGITYRCGHTDTLQLYGPGAGREYEINRREKMLCEDCYLAERMKSAQSSDLPTLQGSEKQIVWAADIRKKALQLLAETRQTWSDDAQYAAFRSTIEPEDRDRFDAARKAALNIYADIDAKYRAETSAKWWIDNRNDAPTAEISRRLATLELGKIRRIQKPIERVDPQPHPTPVPETPAEIAVERSETACRQFRPLRAERTSADNFVVYGDMGHEAKGYVDCGEYAIYDIDGMQINSLLPEATKLAALAARMLKEVTIQ